MTPFEGSGGLLSRLPWESSHEEALIPKEGTDRKQAELDNVVFVYFRILHQSPDVMTDLQHVYERAFSRRNDQGRAMASLESAANAKDEHAFVEALKGVEWRDRSPAEFTRAARWALKAGAYRAAYQISAEGAEQHPDNAEVQKYARVLAPPRVVAGMEPLDSGHKANREWLKEHGGEYSGQWVAVRNGELLGASSSLDDLAGRLGDTKDVLLTKAF